MQNEHIAEMVAGRPDRFVGLATVPLQDVDAAAAELRHAVLELGLRGVEICTNVNGLDLDDERFRPFFAAEMFSVASVPTARRASSPRTTRGSPFSGARK